MLDQSDQSPAAQKFHSWEKSPRTYRLGVASADFHKEVAYVPLPETRRYLNDSRTENLLKSLYGNNGDDIPATNYVISGFLRPFAILVSIGYGKWIHLFLQKQTLRDEKFPVRSKPPDFPESSDDELWRLFFARQWKFYPESLVLNMEDWQLCEHHILPIQDVVHVDSGGTSDIFKFKLDPDYDRLTGSKNHAENERSDKTCAPRGPSVTYVVKCLRGLEAAQYCKAEKTAYKRLELNDQYSEHFLCFYGNFISEGKYYLVFDLADIGTLEDYMKLHDPPDTGRDILKFWKQVLTLLKGLHILHNVRTPESDEHYIQGWHQDLKPKNILLRSQGRESVLEADFVLADFGLSHFRRIRKNKKGKGKARDSDTQGTYAYGAPETLRYDGIEDLPLQVGPKVDIWSLGCILSEVATWIVQGWQKVIEYRRRREEQVQELDKDGSDMFHDGEHLLPVVKECHNIIIKSIKPYDVITEKVIRDLVDNMLIVEEESRIDMHKLVKRKDNIIGKAERELRDMNNQGKLPISAPVAQKTLAPIEEEPPPQAEGVRGEEPSPQWTLEAAWSWKRDKSPRWRLSMPYRLPMPHEGTFKQLQYMRHVFYIDNTETMKQYKASGEVEKVIETLGYILKRMNTKGIDMYFTTSNHHVKKAAKSSALVKCLSKAPFTGESSMAQELEKPLKEFERSQPLPNRIHTGIDDRDPDPRLSIYVLTDGLWKKSVYDVIENNLITVVGSLHHRGVWQHHLGIQFIRFGDNPFAIQGLERLDNLDRLFKLPLDVVDTTPARGCAVKMLMGGHDKKFDADEK